MRCPDHEITLVDSEGAPNPVTLIQMPNGTGKTTTLQLLRATLSGEAREWPSETVRSLSKKGAVSERGQFLIEALCDGKRLTIVLDLDFLEGSASYSTTFGSGNKPGFHPPSILQRFLRPDFVRLFVFDGEQAEHLLNHKHTNAHDAIDSLFQLRFFDGMRDRVNEVWKDHINNAKAKDERGFSRRKNRVETLRERLEECRKEYSQACIILTGLQKQLDTKKRQFRNDLIAHKEYSERLRRADQALQGAKNDVHTKASEAHARVRDPHALSPRIAKQLADLRANLDRVKLPESTAREFFEELAAELECVCGRPMDDACRNHIREQAGRYLGSDDVALLNAMKSDISNFIGTHSEEHAIQLNEQLDALREAVRKESEARTIKDAIEHDAVADTEHPEFERVHDEISRLEKQVAESQNLVEKYQDPSDSLGDDYTFGVEVLERRYKDAERKLAEITQTMELRTKRDILDKILADAHALARSSIAQATAQQANDRIDTLMPSNNIRIKEIRNCLVLEGQEGGSMGETLSVAYAFLATFFNSADHIFPFIVDSPAGSIDNDIRPRIADLVPKLTKQFVAFLISSERPFFSDRLLEKASNETTFVTLFRKGSHPMEERAKGAGDCQETLDGLLVPSVDFFNQFQSPND